MGSTVTGEAGSSYKFNVEAEGTAVSVLVDGNEIGTSNGSYEVAFDADKKITVKFAETEVKEEKYTITFQITGNGKVTDTEGTEISSLTGKVNEELSFKVEAENADSKVTVKMDDKELTAADGVYTLQGKSDATVNVNIEDPEKEEIAYTLYVEHFLDTNKGSYHKADAPVELTEADFKDGKIDVSKYEFKRTGMALVSAETLTKEDFDKDGKGYAEIHYKVADGWKIVDNRPSYRTIYLGNLDEDNPDIVPEGDYFTLKVKFSFEDGSSVANDFTAKYLVDEDSSKNTYTISVPKQEGYYPTISDEDVTLSEDGTSLSGSYSEKGSKEITVEYKVKQLQYMVEHAFEAADGSGYTVDNSRTKTFSGDYGELTEAKAVVVDGFTPEEIADEVLTRDGIVITIKYDRNTYWLTYDANGGTYVPRESGKYEQVMGVKGNDATTRVGYTFAGWYLDKELTKAAGSTIELTEDTVLYAKWEAKKVGYSIVYLAEDINGADGNHDRYIKTVYVDDSERGNTALAGEKIVVPDSYLMDSSLGVEHYHKASYDTNVIAKADGTSEVRVYYDLNVYEFIFNVATESVNGKIVFGNDAYTGKQYSFKAKYGQNVSDKWPSAENVSGLKYGSKCYFETWGDNIATKRLVIGDAEVPDTHVHGESRTFNATWTWSSTKVVGHYFFEKVDGSGYEEDPSYESAVYASKLGQKKIEGYIIKDEYKKSEYIGGVRHYYFKYDRESYKLYFYNDSTSPEKTKTIKYGYPLTEHDYTPKAPAGKTDYTFGGWYDNSACEGARIDLANMTMPKANLALYAKWIAPEYDVNFISEGNTLHTDKVEKGSTVNPYTDPVRDGYSFIGWYDSASPDANLFDFAKPIAKTTNIYAHWKANTETTYIVRYLDKESGKPVYPETTPIRGKVGSNVVAKAINADGYFVDAKSKSIVLSAEAEKNIITFYYYKIGSVEFQYVIKYVDDNNNVIYSSDNLTTKDNILTVAADAKKALGYIITPTRITKNMAVGEVTEFVFNCTAKSYNITYVNVEGTTWNGAGANPNPATYKTTDADITLVNPSKPYFEFAGWTCRVEDTDGEPHDPMHTVISTGSYGDLVFTATWEEVFPTETITITAASDEKMYDGMPLTNNGYTYTQGILHPGDELTAVVVGSQTDADKTGVNEVKSYKVTRTTSDGTIDVTSKYNITTAPGELKVKKRSVIFTSGDGYKVYDGTALTNSNVVISGDGFADGEGVSFNVTGSQLVAGKSENTFAYTLNEGTKAVNYDIRIQLGTLEVAPVSGEFKVIAGTSSRMYDGTPFSYNKYELEGTLESGDKLVVTIEGQLTDVGDTENKITDVKVMNGIVDVTASYPKISTINGKLTVTPRTVILSSGSAEKEYDGTPLTNKNVTIGGDGFAGNEGMTFNVTGSQTDVGESPNDFTYAWNEGTKEKNYKVETNLGKLTVTKNTTPIHIIAGSDSKKYDGTELTCNTYSSSSLPVSGDKLVVMIEGRITNAGTVINEIRSVKVMRGLREVTQNYSSITKENGKLEVVARDIVMTSATDTKVYDGTPLTNDTITVTGDGFIEGEGATYQVTGSQTVAGSSKNTFTYSLNDGTLKDNYNISTIEGDLTVTPSKDSIVITAANDSKIYDGTPLANNGYTYTGKLAGDDELVVTVEGSRTDAGTADNVITGYKVMRGSQDVTKSYAGIITVNGTLTIEQRKVTLISADDSKEYDGTPLTNDTVTVSGDGFVDGEGAAYNVTGSQTLVGSSPNTFSYALNAKTKPENYSITKKEGTLTVNKNLTEIIIKASDAEKKYDGTPLSKNTYSKTGELAAGDTIEVMVSGSITDVGKTGNVVTEVKIMRGSENVTDYYGNISTTEGILTVTKRKVTFTSASDSKEYDGTPLINKNVTISGDGFANGEGVTFNVTGSQTEAGNSWNTFEVKWNKGTSEGNYEISKVEGLLEVTQNKTQIIVTAGSDTRKYDGTELVYNKYSCSQAPVDGDELVVMVAGSITDVGKVENRVTSVKVMRGSKDVTDSYSGIHTEDGWLTVTKRDVILTSASDSKEYDGTPLTNGLVTVSGDGFAKGEGAAYDVTGSQTFAGSSDNTFTYELNQGTKADNYNVIEKLGWLTVTATDRAIVVIADDAEKKYDGTPLTRDNFTYTGNLADGDKLVVTVEGTITNAGTQGNIITDVKVMHGSKEVTDSYSSISRKEGTLKVTKRNVTLTSADASKEYDGKPLTNDTVTVGGDGFVKGEGAAFHVTGSQLKAGSSDNTFTYSLNQGTLEGNYEIEKEEGLLTVTQKSNVIKVTAASDSKMYDGTELTRDTFSSTGELAEGDSLSVTVAGSITDAGSVNNEISEVKIMHGTEEVTDSYRKIEKENGTLTVARRDVVLTSADDSKEYDGTPLTNATVTVSGSGFAAGEGAVYDVTGSQTEAGSSANAFTYQLNDGTKKDNYNITKAEGTLNVTKRLATITVTAGNDSKKYDGTELRSNTYSSTGKLADGETLLVMVEGSITNVGSTDNNVASVKVMRGEKEVTSNYENIVKVSGTLTVTKRNVILTSATDSKAYDGTPLTNSNITVGGDGFAEGEGAAYDVTGSQTVAGTSDNTFTYTLNKGTLEGNYDITKAVGKLTVTASENVIIVTAASADKTYDGTPLTDAGYSYTGELAGDDKVVATVEGSITDAGTQENKVTEVRIMRGTEEVTDSYSHIDKVSGTLTVTKRNVILKSADDSKAYDGTPLTNSNVTAGGDGFAAGEGASYDVTGSQTKAGSSPNTFSYVLNEGTKGNNYNIIKNDGTLTVTPNLTEIRIKASDADKKYDGTPLSRNAYSRIGELVEGDTLEVMVAGSITDAGSTDNIVTGVKVMRGSEDVTSSYGNIVFEKGTLTVTQREVILTSASDSKAYDGTALTNSMVTVSGDGFAEGEGASYNVTGSQTEAGKSDNTFTYKLNKGTKEDNYVIVPKEGVLEVTRNMTEISVTAGSAKEKYNGAPLLSNTYFSTGTLADGDSLVVMVEGQITDVGTVANTVTSVKVMRGSKDVTDSYGNIITANGELEVTKREVILTSASDSKEYDGTPLTNDLVTVSGDDFVKGEGAAYDVTGSQTFAGTSENIFTYALKDNTKADNYEVTTVFGNLEVTNKEAEKRIITITAASDTKPYDGTALTKASADVEDQLLADTDTLLFTVEGSQTIVGSSANKVQNVSIMNGTEDVTDYYTVITADGTLKVTGSITYNENGGSGNVPEDSNQYDYDADITLMGAGELYRDNAVFLGWSEAPTALVESQEAEAAANILGSTIRMGETNITVYAVWAIDENGPDGGPDDTPDYKEYPITYYGNGGSGSVTDTNIYPVDYDVTLLANGFSKDGNHFTGWGIDAQGSAVYQPGNTLSMVEGGLSVYAQWAANPAPTPEDPEPNPNPNPTPDTTPSTTGVLGEALPPAQPEVGVLGEAAGPEVGVLGESKGPGTGDTAPIAGWSFLIMGAVLTLGITAKRRKKDEK